MSDQDLTAYQLKAKARVEANGGTFVPPGQYRKVKKSAVKAAPHMVAQYTAKKQYKETYKRISPETEEIIDQILDPEAAANNSVRWPNTYGNSAIYSVKNVINARFASDNRCAVSVHPRLRNSIFTTAGGTYGGTLQKLTTDGHKPYFAQAMSVQAPQFVNMSSPIYYGGGHATLPVPNEGVERLCYPCGFSENVGTNEGIIMNMNFPNAKDGQIYLIFDKYNASFGLISSSTYETDGSGNLSVQIFNAGVGDTAPSFFSIRITTSSAPWSGLCNGVIASQSVGAVLSTFTLPDHAQHMVIYDIKDADTIIENGERYMVLAQSLLCTSQMSDINNGGAIAIARVPGGTVVGEGSSTQDSSSWYEWISSLSTNNYDGATKNGAYGFYLPDDERGFFYRDVGSFFTEELPYLTSEFTVADVSESSIVRIKVCTTVQFTTNSSTFQLAPSGVCYEVNEIHHLLSLVSACYENDTHRDALRKKMQVIGGRVKKIVKNPRNWEKGAAMLASLLL